ncbi:MAG TPA: methyltransferase domain-containing protein [Mycobacteriales bacterium]|jgi:ubiquinone/menaquinone biosynthesis C-methylase UbiE|nr:methyltransferase domain-containing protein [Mycobacteriales bacterium]
MPLDRARPRTAVRTAVVWDILRAALAERAAECDVLAVLDIGGGTGGFAVPLAELGYFVTVVDPSPDALAALERRAAETGTSALIRGVQGDAGGLVELLGAASVDAVVCHSVLEVVDDPGDALAAMAAVLRPGGVASVLAANRIAAVVARVAAGRLAEARHLLADPAGHAGGTDPLLRRFAMAELEELIAEAGLVPRASHGVRVFADIAPAALLDIDPKAVSDLIALEQAASGDPAYSGLATALHVLADQR